MHVLSNPTNWDERLTLLVSVYFVLIDVVFSLFSRLFTGFAMLILSTVLTLSSNCCPRFLFVEVFCSPFVELRLYCSCFFCAEFFFPGLTLVKGLLGFFFLFVLFNLKFLSVGWAQFVVSQCFLF